MSGDYLIVVSVIIFVVFVNTPSDGGNENADERRENVEETIRKISEC